MQYYIPIPIPWYNNNIIMYLINRLTGCKSSHIPIWYYYTDCCFFSVFVVYNIITIIIYDIIIILSLIGPIHRESEYIFSRQFTHIAQRREYNIPFMYIYYIIYILFDRPNSTFEPREKRLREPFCFFVLWIS